MASYFVTLKLGVLRFGVLLLGVLLLGGLLFGAPAIEPPPVSMVSAASAVQQVSLSQAVPQASRWLPPIEAPLRVSGTYREPPSPYASGHRGIDLPAVPGAHVSAPVSGSVSFVGKVVDRGVISLRVDEHTVVSFEPIDTSVMELTAGDIVIRGELLGVVGEGGHCLSECVHLGVRIDGAYVNPMRFFVDKPILLPW